VSRHEDVSISAQRFLPMAEIQAFDDDLARIITHKDWQPLHDGESESIQHILQRCDRVPSSGLLLAGRTGQETGQNCRPAAPVFSPFQAVSRPPSPTPNAAQGRSGDRPQPSNLLSVAVSRPPFPPPTAGQETGQNRGIGSVRWSPLLKGCASSNVSQHQIMVWVSVVSPVAVPGWVFPQAVVGRPSAAT
jgi:hypothetical protein